MSLIYFVLLALDEKPYLMNAIKTGEVELHCAINGDWEKSLISPEKVKNYNADLRWWTFTNGGAKNCEIINK